MSEKISLDSSVIGYIMAKVRICFYFYANFTKVCYDQREFH